MSKFNVLVVEDSAEVRHMLASAIISLGPDFKVTKVPSAEEGFMETRLQKFDLVISDVDLPGRSGLEMLQQVRSRQPNVKYILLSGIVDESKRQEISDAGVDAYFIKPVVIADFLDTIEHVLGLLSGKTVEIPTQPIKYPSQVGKVEEEPEEVPKQRVSDVLVNLRERLGAISVVMLSDRGRVLVQAGDLPDAAIESAVMPVLMGIFSGSQRVSHFLGYPNPNDLLMFGGTQYDLVMSHIGRSYALLIAKAGVIREGPVGRIGPIIRQAVDQLKLLLVDMGVKVHPEEAAASVPPFVLDIEPDQVELPKEMISPDLDIIFDTAEPSIPQAELDSFWDDAAESTAGAIAADSLSYDQASQLGLAPSEDEE